MSGYDPNLHQKFADTLQLRAKRIAIVFTAMAAIVGAGLGVALPRIAGKPSTAFPVIVATFVLGIFGFVAGKERSFSLCMRAHELLCQKQIEENTRKAGASATAAAK